MPYAVLSLATRAVQIDHEGAYSVVEGGQKFRVDPMSMGDGPAIFPELDEAEAWRADRLKEMSA